MERNDLIREALCESRAIASLVAGYCLDDFAVFRTAVLRVINPLGGPVPVRISAPNLPPQQLIHASVERFQDALEMGWNQLSQEQMVQMKAAAQALRSLKDHVLVWQRVNCATIGAC